MSDMTFAKRQSSYRIERKYKMLQGVREFLESTAGKVVSVILILVALIAIYFSVRSNFGQSDAASMSADRMFVDSTTGKPFSHELVIGEKLPVKAPSGGMTGYPAELCFWNADGTIRSKPYPVLVNAYLGKKGPTFCPDCGRLVVPHNPMPMKGDTPPPTKAEYDAHPHSAEQ